MMQAVTMIFPLVDVYRSRSATRAGTVSSSASWTNDLSKNRDSYSMASLELQLERNIEPLLKWTAERDFTAENILFLKAVRDMKRRWGPLLALPESPECHIRGMYKEAAMIYFVLVNPHTAQFNINIDYKTLRDLATIFNGVEYCSPEGSTSSRSSQSDNVVTPWSDSRPTAPTTLDVLKLEVQAQMSMVQVPPVDERSLSPFPLYAPNGLCVPPTFSIHVFDRAYDIVKQDVFHNSWMRYEAVFGRPRSVIDFPSGSAGGASSKPSWVGSWRPIKKAASALSV